jgi:homoserine kinase
VTTILVRAPASTANLGPGFDCAAAALELWNTVEVTEGGDPDETHLGVRAFARVTAAEAWSFRWTEGIPRERGLGSSAAVVALGLVAGSLAVGRAPDAEELLSLGISLEGHADNLAAALTGGVCLTWDGRIARVADRLPAVPVALVPATTVSTVASRAALPASVSHEDAAFTAGRAALLGAAAAAGSAALFAAALDDRLHEPYRGAEAPLLREVRGELPAGAVGASLSGSGPTVIVWAEPERATECADDLRARFADVEVRELAFALLGACAAGASGPQPRTARGAGNEGSERRGGRCEDPDDPIGSSQR